jgi:hypothetical protein
MLQSFQLWSKCVWDVPPAVAALWLYSLKFTIKLVFFWFVMALVIKSNILLGLIIPRAYEPVLYCIHFYLDRFSLYFKQTRLSNILDMNGEGGPQTSVRMAQACTPDQNKVLYRYLPTSRDEPMPRIGSSILPHHVIIGKTNVFDNCDGRKGLGWHL